MPSRGIAKNQTYVETARERLAAAREENRAYIMGARETIEAAIEKMCEAYGLLDEVGFAPMNDLDRAIASAREQLAQIQTAWLD